MSITHEDNSSLLDSLQQGLSENLTDIEKAIGTFSATIPLLCKNVLQLFSMYQLLEQQRDLERKQFQEQINKLKNDLNLHQMTPSTSSGQAKAKPLTLQTQSKKQQPVQSDDYECFFEMNAQPAQTFQQQTEKSQETIIQINSQLTTANFQQTWTQKPTQEKKKIIKKTSKQNQSPSKHKIPQAPPDVEMRPAVDFEVTIGIDQLVYQPSNNDSTESQHSPPIKTELAADQKYSKSSISKPDKKEVKFREVVRDRDQRRQLKGQACFRCQKFYSALGCEDDARGADMCNECSRHRDNEAIQNTPPNFYDLDIDGS